LFILDFKEFYDEKNEMDEDDDDQVDGDSRSLVPGIDDGFLIPKPSIDPDRRTIPDGYFPQWPTSYPVPDNNFPNLNLFQQKRTVAQGMLDLALLSSNANQLRYILDYKERNHYYYISLCLISTSLVLQILVAIALVFKSRYNIENEKEYANADRINNVITMGILLITIINVFTSAFGVSPSS
jgi:membrane protein insertase Oxa1/YidC/SpoIIIJ